MLKVQRHEPSTVVWGVKRHQTPATAVHVSMCTQWNS